MNGALATDEENRVAPVGAWGHIFGRSPRPMAWADIGPPHSGLKIIVDVIGYRIVGKFPRFSV